VRLASRLRSFARAPAEAARLAIGRDAAAEAERLCAGWQNRDADWRPGLWFTYHLYYKAPDRLGTAVCSRLGIPYVTAEASHAGKRDRDLWAPWQGDVASAVRSAAINFCFTARDREGLERIGGRAGRLVDLPPFVDPAELAGPSLPRVPDGPLRLATVAMMRPGDKLASYRMLADALARLGDVEWTLSVIGDGPCRGEVERLLAGLPAGRITWLGEVRREALGAHLGRCDALVWPGFGEAYGLAYLEAQAMGLAVVAQRIAGVPEVVRDGVTGLLTEPGSVEAYAAAIRALAADPERLDRMARAARRYVHEERSLSRAVAVLHDALASLPGGQDQE
jgi:glycosyltransferase involved in cell wall biosynthesis